MIEGLYAITPERCDSATLIANARAALRGGARVLQYRRKGMSPTDAHAEASALAEECRSTGAILIINDDPRLATDVSAAGVHLGRNDCSLDEARRILGRNALIGVSCYDRLDLAIHAAEAGADYVAFGSFFPSTVKPHAVRPDVGLIRRAKRVVSVPVVAIGGITVDNAATLIEAGADAVAVITDLFDAPDVAARASAFRRLFENRAPRSMENATKEI
ncbi:MAG: thiamine phosphate synthase [Betaproteobacteria bacterium]|nr:thiamine phosphate synthase [Betaproteobacteria bacterium]